MRPCFAFMLLSALAAMARPVVADPVVVTIEDKDVRPDPDGGIITLDVIVRDIGPPQPRNEDLRGFDMLFILEKVGGGAAMLRFVPPYAQKPDPFIFTGPRTEFHSDDPAATSTSFLLSAFDPDATRLDIPAEPANAARLILAYGPATQNGEYHVRLDPAFSRFTSGPDGPEMISSDLTDVGVVRIVPEPLGLAALGAAGLPLALRLRCRPRT